MKRQYRLKFQISVVTYILLMIGAAFAPTRALAAVTSITPVTWNVVGLDSNSPLSGPNRFPVGARVCSSTGETDLPVTFHWDSVNSYINLSEDLSGFDLDTVQIDVPANGCADAYFEVEVTQNALAFETARRYHIAAGGWQTPQPRELYVKPLVSQARNGIIDLQFGTTLLSLTSVPVGGSFSLVKGETYFIRMTSYTAPGGYEQLETFSTLPNTVFQVLAVETTYTADSTTNVSSPNEMLYGDACYWEEDPDSPNYLACNSDGKIGGTMTVTYQVRIIDVGGAGAKPIYSLIYDLSGASYHYNSDYLSGARSLYVVDPASVTVGKRFTPATIASGGTSTLTITVNNSANGAAMGGLSLTDLFPTSPAAPGQMEVATPPNITNTCGGTLDKYEFAGDAGVALGAGHYGLSLTGGSVGAFATCSIKVDVTAPAEGDYNNQSGYLQVGAVTTTSRATATLTVNDSAIPQPEPICGYSMAQWTFPTGFNTTTPAASSATVTASAVIGAGLLAQAGTTTAVADGSKSWGTNGAVATGATLTTTNNDYFEFALDTTGYTTAYLTFSAKRSANGAKGLAVYEGSTQIWSDSAALSAGTGWTAFGAAGSLEISGGTGTKYIRIYLFNAVNSNAGSDAFIDHVTFTGCKIIPTLPPTISKLFAPATVAVHENIPPTAPPTATLTFTITNPNTSPSLALSGIAFSDTLPAGVEVGSGISAACGGTLTLTAPNTIAFAGGTLAAPAPAATTCQIAVTVKATAPGVYDNISGYVTSLYSGANTTSTGIARATLTAVLAPQIEKEFDPPLIETSTYGGVSTLTLTITNPNSVYNQSGVAFIDQFPANLIVADPPDTNNGCGGTLEDHLGGGLAAGDGGIKLSGVTLNAGQSCTVVIKVTSATAGYYENQSGAVTHLINGVARGGDIASAALAVKARTPAISLLKQVGPSLTGPWGSNLIVAPSAAIYYRFTVENIGDVTLSEVTISEDPDAAWIDLSPCVWKDGDGDPVDGDGNNIFTLPVADADGDHTASCTIAATAAASGTHSNTAKAVGTYTPTTVTDTSTATYVVSTLELTKSVTETSFRENGDTLSYSYAVKNTGAAPLTGPLAIIDDKIASTAITCPAGDLAAGATITCTATYTVTDTDEHNRLVTNNARGKISGFFTPADSVTVTMLAADLSAVKSNDVGGVAGAGTFSWTITVASDAAAGNAVFNDGEVLLLDQLPTSKATYGTVVVTASDPSVTGVIACAVDPATKDLACSADGAVFIPAGQGFSVNVPVTVAGLGTLYNPRKTSTDPAPATYAVCQVDPGNLFTETDEANNLCKDDVLIGVPLVAILKSADKTATGAAPGEEVLYTIRITNNGTAVAKAVTLRDDLSPYTALKLDYDDAVAPVTPFAFSDTTAPPGVSGLTMGTPAYSDDNGVTVPWVYSLSDGGGGAPSGYDGDVTNWKIPMTGTLNIGGSIQLQYKSIVK